MKRVLSLILALVIVLGTMPMAFAADQTAGEMLKDAGFVAGDENGNLMEDQGLTRAQLAVLVAELNGVKENARTYAIAPEFKDVKADDWFGPYVAYAAQAGWFKGDDEGNFNPNGAVSDQMMATVMLRALGYEPAWETAVSEAKAMGLPVDSSDSASMTRGEAFTTMWGVVNTPKKDSDVALGVELGKLEPAQEEVEELVAEIDFARAYGNGLVNVDFIGTVDAAAAGQVANYTIVEKADTTKEIAVLSVDVYDGDDVFLETEGLTAGKSYTVIIGDSKANFAGIAKDSDKPVVDSVKGTDTGEVEVVFDDALLDRATAEDVANYSIDTEGTVVKAEVNNDLDTVTLTIEGMTTTKSKKLTVENVMSTDGVVMTKTIKSFGPDFDKTAPKIDEVKASAHNNVEVLIEWDDDHGVDQATAEDVSNYSIEGLEIIAAKAIYKDSDAQDSYYDKVILTTSEQTKSKRYTLKVNYMVDGSTAANATTKVLSETFTGGTADDDEPKVKSAGHRNLTEIDVVFTEENSLDVSTVLDAGNYTFKDNELEVVDVRFDDADDNGNSYDADITGTGTINKDNDDIKVILTVTQMEEDESYRLQINNIADNFGNAMDKEDTSTIRVGTEVKTYAQIKKITANDLEEIKVEFDGTVTERSAEDATNYVIDGGIGAVKKATWSSADEKTVTLVVPKLTVGKTYKLTVNNVENYWGYACEDVTKSFIATNDEIDTEKPEVDDVDFDNKGEVIVTFSEPMKATVGTSTMTIADPSAVVHTLVLADMRDDDTVLVFNGYQDNTPALLALDTTFDITGFPGLTDKALNTVDYTSGDEEFSTDSEAFDLAVASDDRAVADGLSQENGDVVHVTFDRPIKVAGEGTTTVVIPYDDDDDDAVANDGNYEFTYEIDSDDDQLLIFTLTSGTFGDDSVELNFNFAAMVNKAGGTVAVTDILDRDVSNEIGEVDVDNEDDVNPTLEEIVVVDNVTVELHFDEKLKTTGSYKIWDEDEEEWITNTADWDDSDVRDVVVLTTTKKLTTDNYELTISTSPRDLANNQIEDYKDESYSFVGVDTTPAEKMVAAVVNNSVEITIVNEVRDWVVGDTLTFTKTANGVSSTIVGTYTMAADDEVDVTFAPFYALLSEDAADKAVSYTFAVAGETYDVQPFTGMLEEDDVTVVTTAAGYITLTTNDISYDAANYVYYLVDSGDATYALGDKLAEGTEIKEETNGDITITLGSRAGNTYKLVVVPEDDDAAVANTPVGAIEMITEAFTW
ncbi:MAG: S-layer homology domain-containing protein [Clostridia bacterium]|nr:S-layer homology domain-containing protein [Clostridia bacterium]